MFQMSFQDNIPGDITYAAGKVFRLSWLDLVAGVKLVLKSAPDLIPKDVPKGNYYTPWTLIKVPEFKAWDLILAEFVCIFHVLD